MKRSILIGIGALTLSAATVLGYSVASQASPNRPQKPAQSQQPALPAHALTIMPSVGEDTYVPLAPCRIVDTRAGGGAVVSGATRTVQVTGTTGFTGQGGASSGCGVPAAATAVSVSVTTTAATGTGYVTAYPAGTTRPLSTVISYIKTSSLTASSTVKLGSGQLSLYNHGGSVQVIIDVNGYVAQPIHASINPTGGLYAATSRVLSATNTATGAYTVVTDRDLSGCTVSATIRGGEFYVSAYASGDNVIGTTWALNSTGTAVATNLYWDLTVTC